MTIYLGYNLFPSSYNENKIDSTEVVGLEILLAQTCVVLNGGYWCFAGWDSFG